MDLSPQARETKAKINKWDQIKLKHFFTVKESNRTKTQPTEWGKIFANGMSNKGLLSKLNKELIQLNIKKLNNPIKTWAEDLDRHFSKEETDGQQVHEKMVNITIIKYKCKSKPQ